MSCCPSTSGKKVGFRKRQRNGGGGGRAGEGAGGTNVRGRGRLWAPSTGKCFINKKSESGGGGGGGGRRWKYRGGVVGIVEEAGHMKGTFGAGFDDLRLNFVALKCTITLDENAS